MTARCQASDQSIRKSASIELVYAYSAYGETAVLGPDGGNSLRYTGREDDGSGLFYYRARYYDPALKRFISEDPIGTTGGINLYGYVLGNPISMNDALGLEPMPKGGWGKWWNPVRKFACQLIKGGNKINNLGTDYQISEEMATWGRNIDSINRIAQIEIEECIRRYPNDRCAREACIDEASKKASAARNGEDARHTQKMRELLTPTSGQQVGTVLNEVCDLI